MPRSPRLSESPFGVLAARDPVAAYFEAHERGGLVKLGTSGTLVAPRSVVRTTHSWWASFPTVTRLLSMDSSSRVWVPGPMSSTMNLFAAVHARSVGARVVTGPEFATHSHLTPSALSRTLKAGPDLRGMHVVVAGDLLSRKLSARATAAGMRISHYYGAAELSFVAWGSHEADLRPLPEVEISVREDVVWVRSPFLCQGYDGAPDDAPSDQPGAMRTDDDGFATVGDRGSYSDGRLIVGGRGTAAVTTGGATVHVADVEHVLRSVTDDEVIVLGLPHAGLGEVVAAVLADPAAFPRARDTARSALASAQRPRLWFTVAEPPLTVAGKVDRAALAQLLDPPGTGVRRLS